MTPQEIVKAIDPKNGDKYSPNLHKFCKKEQRWGLHIFVGEWGDSRGQWIGFRDDMGDVCGAQLGRVLCEGSRTETFCYAGGSREWQEIDFWPEYIRIGRCAIDPEHTWSFDTNTRYEQFDRDTRRCNWCGATIKRVEYRITRERWEVEFK